MMTAQKIYSERSGPGNRPEFSGRVQSVSRILFIMLAAIILSVTAAQATNPDGQLRIEIISAYNLVVDSNVTAQSTLAPEAATLGARVCNDGDEVMNEVQVYIGDHANNKPGTYPVFDSAGDSRTWLADTGEYSLTHESGSFASAEDASRAWVGTLEPGECRVEYWVVSYPQCVNTSGGTPQEPPCDAAITGPNSDTTDDLSLSYDIWATGSYGAAETALEADDSRSLTLRSEISAMANKIWPNGDNKVPDEYKAAIEETLGWDTWTPTGSNPFPGQVFETQGIWYDLGKVGAGFDNDGDGIRDHNAWVQPVGDPDVYDPGCFRLVGTYGILIVKLVDGGEQLIPFKDQMYFEHIPKNNGVVGLVFYEYAALNGQCTGTLTPYQEVASGTVEKFNPDYGTPVTITTQEPLASIAKGAPGTAALGSTLTYTLEVTNPDNYGDDSEGNPLTVTIGNPDFGIPLVIRDSIPDGVDYVAGSAQFVSNDSGVTQSGTILYSTDDGATWSSTEPAAPETVTDIEWRMDTPLTSDDSAGANTMKVEFQATVPGTYTEPFVSNTGCAAIGSGPCFDEDEAVTLIEGDKTISGTVFLDDGTGGGTAANGVMDGSEVGEGSVTVTLYYDTNGDGELDDGDIQWGDPIETSTGAGTTGDYSFTNLPDAKFIVVVDDNDSDITSGAAPTTDTEIPANTASGDVTDVDFGFLPPLEVTKEVLGSEPYADGEVVSYRLTVKNTLPGGTSTLSGGCYYDLYPGTVTLDAGSYFNPENLTSKDGVYGYTDLGTGSNDTLGLGLFALPPIQSGTITDINVVFFNSEEIGGTVGAADYYTTVTINTTTYNAGTSQNGLPIINALGGEYEVDLGTVTPTWTDFQGGVSAVLNAAKANDSTGSWTLDAYALRVYTDAPCPGSSNQTINPVPLKDEFSSGDFTFVSAVPAESNYDAATATLTWDNIGPLAPGEEATVIVNLRAIADGPGTNLANNKAIVEEGTAFFLDGRPANGDEDDIDITLYPAIDISGTLFSDTNSNGWNTSAPYGDDPGQDAYLPGQTVELWACATDSEPHEVLVSGDETGDCDDNTGYDWYLIETTTTAEDGSYSFEGVTQGYYFVKAPTTVYGASVTSAPPDVDNPTTVGGSNDEYWFDPTNGGNLGGDALSTFFRVGGTSGNWTDTENVDFGYGGVPGSVSGHIWEDINSSVSADLTGEYLGGITVELIDLGNDCLLGGGGGNSDSTSTVVTNADGFYQFTELVDGQCYAINVLTNLTSESDIGATGALSSGSWTAVYQAADGEVNPPGSDTTDGYIYFTAANGQFLVDRDFGYEAPSDSRQIDGTIYYDLDGDGVQGANELGVSGITVSLYQDEDGDGVVDPGTDALYTSVPTNPDGSYSFSDLPSGNFLVVVDDTPIATYQQIEDPDVAPGGGVCVGTQCDSDGKADLTGGDVTGLDFGYQPPQAENSISGLVWTDIDGDASKNSSAETGIGDVTVTLQWTPDGGTTWLDVDTQTASDGTSDVDGDGSADPVGSYHFGDLPNGTYRVAVSETDPDLPQGLGGDIYTPTTGTDAGDYRYFEQTLTGSTTSTGNDFGFTPNGAIGDSVYWDVNGDGSQGTNEPGIEGVTVELYTFTDDDGDGRYDVGESLTPTGKTAVTDADGKYLFYGLEADNYAVIVQIGAGTPIGTAPQTADPDSDGLLCTDSTLAVPCDNTQGVSINGNSYMGADFGYEPPLFIGDQLFIDMDGDGSPMEENDLPLAYVPVTLTDCGTDGCGVGTDITYTLETDENGNYAFVNGATDLNGNEISLTGGNTYTVTVNPGDLPTDYGTLSPSYNGNDSDGTTDNSIELTLGLTPTSVDDADMGFEFPPVNNLSGTVCQEGVAEAAGSSGGYCGTGGVGVTDPEGVDPSAEVAYEGTTVYVSKWTDANNDGNVDAGELVPITQTVTDENGNYEFTGLPSVSETNESYLVSLDAPADLLDLSTELADTPAGSLKEYTDLNGYTSSAWQSISVADNSTVAGLDFAFEQTAAFDFGDLPLPFETTLDIDGARHLVPDPENPDLYLGSGVTVEADGQPSAGSIPDDKDDGVVADTDTWSEGTGGGSVDVTSFGEGWLVAWIDFNGDGSFSGADEMIISQALGTAGTSETTSISFDIPTDGLDAPGYARFRFFPEEPPLPSIAFKGAADNGEVEDYLFDLSNPSSIGDSILLDTNGDGIPDQGFEGVVVELINKYCIEGVDCPKAVTDADGHYLFTGVGLGDYTVKVTEIPDLPAEDYPDGVQPIYDPDSLLDGETTVSITEPGTEYLDADFWYGSTLPTTGTIGDTVWNDADGDGVQDLGESGIGNVTVALKYSDGSTVYEADGITPVTAVTGPDGSYLFTDVAPNNYIIEVDATTLPAGIDETNQTGDPDVPGASCGGSCDGETQVTITPAGETILTADFGYQFSSTPTSDIGDTISYWDDADDNGVQGPGELSGIVGVTVVLKDSNGDIIAQDVTDSNGNYLFPDLPPGDYTVEVTDTNGELDSYALAADPNTGDGLSESYSLTTTGGTDYLDVDFVYTDPVPTYATVSAFKAYLDADNQVVLEWTTASEIGTIGFYLERLNERSGKYQAVTEQLLPGMLSPPHGGTYRFVDKQAEPEKSATYRVVEVAVNDQGIISGPYTVQASAALPVTRRQMFAGQVKGYTLTHQDFSKKQLRRFAARDISGLKLAAAKQQQTGTTLKIPVNKDGLVYLTASELATTSGISKDQITDYLKSDQCLVTFEGAAIPVVTANTGSGLWFYGRAPERKDIAQNIYLLELGEIGVKMEINSERAEEVVEEVRSFTGHVRVEENLQPLHFYLYNYHVKQPVEDLWAWEFLLASEGDAGVVHLVETPHMTGTDTAVVRANLVNITSKKTGQAAPYKISLSINGTPVGETVETSEQGDWQVQAAFPAQLLKQENEIEIVSHLNNGVAYSFIFLESIEIDYPRTFQAINGELFFHNAEYNSVTVQGFRSSRVLVFDVTEPNNPLRVKTLPGKNQQGEYTVTVLTEPGHEYFMTENIRSTVSEELVVDIPSQLKNTGNSADYLIIAPSSLISSAQGLADHRESQGLTSMIVDIENVRDEFTHGSAAPEAVHNFLAYAYEHWAHPPRYVTLIGDGSFDYRDYLDYGTPLIPTELVSTPDGLFPSDNALADVVGDDGVPEFALGRIPVIDSAELDAYISKLIAYEQAVHENSNVMMLVTDKSDSRAGDFQASTDQVTDLASDYFQINRIDVDTLGYSQANDSIISMLQQQGAGILHYIGHSSATGYASGKVLLSTKDIEEMNPIASPLLMVSMACSSGFFGYPPMNSLGETAVLKADGAAVGFFGATGLSRNYLADILAEGFYSSLFDSENRRLGDAVTQAKQHYFNVKQGEKRYTLDIYNLLGDSALLIPGKQ